MTTTTTLLYIIYIPPPVYCTLLMYNRRARRERPALRGDGPGASGKLIRAWAQALKDSGRVIKVPAQALEDPGMPWLFTEVIFNRKCFYYKVGNEPPKEAQQGPN